MIRPSCYLITFHPYGGSATIARHTTARTLREALKALSPHARFDLNPRTDKHGERWGIYGYRGEPARGQVQIRVTGPDRSFQGRRPY